MAGMRGLMTDPSGRIIDLPIRSSFREGLTVLEYFISTHGARKGLADTALRTADSGYLTRRLIDVAQDVIIRDGRLRHADGHLAASQPESGVLETLSERIVGRYVGGCDVEDPETGEVLVERNQEINEEIARRASSSCKIERVYVRSPLTCEAKRGICQYCYGRSLGARRAGRDGRGRGHHRRAVHRRAGHAAHDAHVPHRWCGARRRHHERSAPRGGAVRGAHPEGPGDHQRDRRRSWSRARPSRRVKGIAI